MNWLQRICQSKIPPDDHEGPGDMIHKHYGVWQYSFNQVKHDPVEGYYLDWFEDPGSIHDITKVSAGDKIADNQLNMTPYWEVSGVDENKGRIYVIPIGQNPWLTGVGAGGAKLTEHDFDVYTGKFEKERVDAILDAINKKQYFDPRDISYILQGTVPLQMGPNGSQGGWYSINDRWSNRGGQKGMSPIEIMQHDAAGLRKLGIDVPIGALEGTLDPDSFNEYINGQSYRDYLMEGEDPGDLMATVKMIKQHHQPAIKKRNWEFLMQLKPPESVIRNLLPDISQLKHPHQDVIPDTFDPYWLLKEQAIGWIVQHNSPELLQYFENTTDTESRKNLASAYGQFKMTDQLVKMEQASSDPEVLKNIFYSLYKLKYKAVDLLAHNPAKYVKIIGREQENSAFGYHAKEFAITPVWTVQLGLPSDGKDIEKWDGVSLTIKQCLEKIQSWQEI